MPILDVAGTPIRYEVHGDGPPLVLLHAISAGMGMWRAQLRRFARTHRVVVLDARGVGESGVLGPVTGPRAVRARFADDLAALLDHLGIDRACVVGVSFGGVVAQAFAERHPGRVAGLVLVDTYGDTRPTTPARALWLGSVLAGSTANLLPRRVLAAIVRAQYRRWPGAAVELGRSIRTLRHVDAMRTRIAITPVDFRAALRRLEAPILGVVGGASWWRSGECMAELAAAVPAMRLVRIPDANDPTPLCRPAVFDAVLAAFLDEHGL